MRFLLCLAIQPVVCPAHRPDLNAFVERYHRSLKQECLLVVRPQTLEQVREANEAFVQHYNQERPNQALSCGNRPPSVAFPSLPSLPPVPGFVDPDAWLRHIDGAHFMRKVRSNGSVLIDDVPYYLKPTLSGQYVDVCVHAAKQELVVWHRHQPIKRLPIKGLKQSLVTFEQFVAFMAQEALSEHRRLLHSCRRHALELLMRGGNAFITLCFPPRSSFRFDVPLCVASLSSCSSTACLLVYDLGKQLGS